MKDKNENIDHLLRSRLNDYSSASPVDLWDRIDAERSKKDNDRNGIIWWRWSLAGLMILFVATGLFLFTKNNSTKSIGELEQKETLSTIIDAETTVAQLEQKELMPTIADAQTNESNNDNLLLDIKDVSSENVIKQQISEITINPTTLKAQIATQSSSKNSIEQVRPQSITPTTSAIFNQELETILPEELIQRNIDLSNPKKLDEAVLQQKNTQEEAISKNYLKAIFLEQNKSTALLYNRTVSADLLKFKKQKRRKKKPSKGAPRGCYSFPGGAFKYDFYVDVIGSLEMVSRSLTSKNSEYDYYAENRENSESTMFAFSSGVRLSFVTEKGVALRTGLIYSQILERFTYTNVRTQVTETQEIYDLQGNVIGYDTTFTSGTKEGEIYNRYRSVDVPLILGKEFYGNRFNFNINGGVYFNIWSKQKGQLLAASSTNLVPIRFNSKDPTAVKVFHDRLGISLYTSIGVNYKLSDHFQLLIEPNLRYQFHSITVDDYPLSQKYMNIGLMTGLRLQF